MTSGNDASEALNPRLAEARDSVLREGERVIAQEEGDQGQAIVLTDARVLIIKAGIAATGQADGRIIGGFPLGEIAAINVRKGPLGAVIQIVAGERPYTAQGGSPDNVIIFTGPARVKRCDAIAAAIEPVLGKPLGRVQAQPAEPKTAAAPVGREAAAEEVPEEKTPGRKLRGGREPRSLAEEMFGEISQRGSVPEAPSASEPVASAEAPQSPVVQEDAAVEEPNEDTESDQLTPNPNLPKPVRRGRGTLDRVLVLLGLLMAAILVCVGVTAPLRHPEKTPSIEIDVSRLTRGSTAAIKQQAALAQYESDLAKLLAPCREAVAKLTSAVRSGNTALIRPSLCEGAVNQCWQKLSRLEAPAGLGDARESVVSGVLTLKSAVAGVAASLQSSAPVNSARVLSNLQDGQNRIDKGLSLMLRMSAELKPQQAQTKPGARGK